MSTDSRHISFLGPPGSGKTTQIRLLEERLGDALTVASVPRLLRGQSDLIAVLTDTEQADLDRLRKPSAAARDRGQLAPTAVDVLLLAAVARLETPYVALDGCPRGVEQAQLFLAGDLPSSTTVVELRFPTNAAASSLRRQVERETERRGAEAAVARRPVFESKVRVFIEDTTPGLQLLDAASMPHIILPATDPAASIHERICEAIGITIAHQLDLGVGR